MLEFINNRFFTAKLLYKGFRTNKEQMSYQKRKYPLHYRFKDLLNLHIGLAVIKYRIAISAGYV
jgi:hypothetical protein